MSETKKKICQFQSKYDPDYKCPEPPLEDSENGYCIFHEPREDKDIEKFNEGIKRKLNKRDYNFRGYWFPVSISFDKPSPFAFKGETTFAESTFKKWVGFGGSTFEEEANFAGSTFEAEAYFVGSTFEGAANFWASTFERKADLRRATFKKWADFREITFERKADFREATFEGEAYFAESTFKGRADFGRLTFKGRANFTDLTLEKVIFLDDIKIGDPAEADILFRNAKIAWHREGNYVEEGKCHYQEMDYIRKQKNWFVRYILANLFHRLLYGYGEKPFWIFAWCAGLIIFSSVIYWISKGVLKIVGVRAVPVEDYWNSLYFSVVTFTTLGYGDFRPIGKVKILASIEAILGIFFVALFIFTFARRTAGR